MDDEGFTIVRRAGHGRPSRSSSNPGKTKPSAQISYISRSAADSPQSEMTMEEKLGKVLAILETRKRQLEDNSVGKGKERPFMDTWTDQITAVRNILRVETDSTSSTLPSAVLKLRIVCLGIGIVNESRESQFQFLLLDMLGKALEVPAEEVWVYDPLFTPIEVALLKNRGYQLISKNERGKHKLDASYNTLVYMPHCPGKLYDAFIRENWDERILGGRSGPAEAQHSGTAESLLQSESEDLKPRVKPKVVLLANDFRGYIDNLPRRRVEEELPSLSRLTPHLSTIPFPSLSPSHIASNAFNSLVFQYISAEESRKVDWDSIPPEGSREGGAAQTEVIEAEIKKSKEECEEEVPARKVSIASGRC